MGSEQRMMETKTKRINPIYWPAAQGAKVSKDYVLYDNMSESSVLFSKCSHIL